MAAADMRNKTIVAVPGTPQLRSVNPQPADPLHFRAPVDAFRTKPPLRNAGTPAHAPSSHGSAVAARAKGRGIAIGPRAEREVVPADPTASTR